MKWLDVNSTACRGVNTDRCLNKELGGNVQWNLNKRDVVCQGNEKSHKCLKMFSHKAGYKSILENLEAQTIHLQVDNMVDLQYVLNIGGIRTQNVKLVILAKEI